MSTTKHNPSADLSTVRVQNPNRVPVAGAALFTASARKRRSEYVPPEYVHVSVLKFGRGKDRTVADRRHDFTSVRLRKSEYLEMVETAFGYEPGVTEALRKAAARLHAGHLHKYETFSAAVRAEAWRLLRAAHEQALDVQAALASENNRAWGLDG
jgi:hypothetical protein